MLTNIVDLDFLVTTKIAKLSVDDQRWLDFVCRQPSGSIFHHPAWIATLTQCYGHPTFVLVLTNPQGEILAGMPIMQIKSWLTGFRWVSLPFSDYCPPLSQSQCDLNLLLDGLLQLNKEINPDKIEIRWQTTEREGCKLLTQHVLHSLNLEAGLQTIYNNCSRKFRQYPHRAQRLGLEVNSEARPEDIEAFYRLHLKTRRKLGVPIQPKKYFRLLNTNVIQKGLGKVVIVSHNKKPLSAAIILHFNNKSMIKYSASDPSYLDMRSQYYLFWKCIEWSCQQGHCYMDFGKTDISDEGLRHFKNGWGTNEEFLPYSYIGNSTPNPSSGRLNILLRQVVRHSPPLVCRLAGELLYKHFA